MSGADGNEGRKGPYDFMDDPPDQEMFEAEGELDIRMGDVPTMDQDDEPLREIWQALDFDIEQDLTVRDLKRVCDNIGLDMTREELEDLFSRLDHDGDGRISFAEVHEGLFQHGLSRAEADSDDPLGTAPPSHIRRSTSPTSKRHSSLFPQRLSLDDSMRGGHSSLSPGVSGIFSSLDTEMSGQCWPSDLLEYWASIGVGQGEEVLQDLGFDPRSTTKITLVDLSFLLTQELSGVNLHNVRFQAAFLSYQQEFHHNRGLLEQLTAERKKLRKDLTDANTRNELLVKEADERYLKIDQSSKDQILTMEQKYQSEIKALQSQIDEERENSNRQLERLRCQLEEKMAHLHQEEASLKEDLSSAQREIEKLETDISELMDQLDESETQNTQLRKELLMITEGQSSDDVQRFSQAKLHQVQQENKELKDKVDELTMEVERLRQDLRSSKRRSANQSDSPTSSPSTKRRRQVSIEYLRSEEAMDDEAFNLLSEGPVSESFRLEAETHAKELEQMKNNFELERKDIEQAFKMEIVEIEEGHDRDRKQLLHSFTREKEKMREELDSVHQGELAELERTLQNAFAAEKQDMLLKHESEKNYIQHKFTEEKEKLMSQPVEEKELKKEMSVVESSDPIGSKPRHEERMKEDIRKEKALLLDRFLKERRELEEAHSQEKAALFQDVEVERKELVQKYESQIAGLESEITSVRERLESARDALLQAQANGKASLHNQTEAEREMRESLMLELREELIPEIREQLTPELRDKLTQELRERLLQEVKEETEETFVAQIQKIRSAFEEERRMMGGKQKQIQQELDEMRQAERKHNQLTEKLQDSNQQLLKTKERLSYELEKQKLQLEIEKTERNTERVEHERERAELEREKAERKNKQTEHERQQIRHQRSVELLRAEKVSALEGQARAQAQYETDKSDYQKLLEEKQALQYQLNSANDELSKVQDNSEELEGQLAALKSQLSESKAAIEKMKAEHSQEVHSAIGGSETAITVEQLTALQLQLREAEGRARECERRLKEEQQNTKFTLINADMLHKLQLSQAKAENQQLLQKLEKLRSELYELSDKLQGQCERSFRTDVIIKDLNGENSKLREALYITEKRQKDAEEKYYKMAELYKAFKSVALKTSRTIVAR